MSAPPVIAPAPAPKGLLEVPDDVLKDVLCRYHFDNKIKGMLACTCKGLKQISEADMKTSRLQSDGSLDDVSSALSMLTAGTRVPFICILDLGGHTFKGKEDIMLHGLDTCILIQNGTLCFEGKSQIIVANSLCVRLIDLCIVDAGDIEALKEEEETKSVLQVSSSSFAHVERCKINGETCVQGNLSVVEGGVGVGRPIHAGGGSISSSGSSSSSSSSSGSSSSSSNSSSSNSYTNDARLFARRSTFQRSHKEGLVLMNDAKVTVVECEFCENTIGLGVDTSTLAAEACVFSSNMKHDMLLYHPRQGSAIVSCSLMSLCCDPMLPVGLLV